MALRLKLGQADLDGILAREREIKEAEARGRGGGEGVEIPPSNIKCYSVAV